MIILTPFVFLAFIFPTLSAQVLIATDPGATCSFDEECPPNQYCLFDTLNSPVCSPFAGLGEVCNSFATCGEGLFCDGSSSICQKGLPLNATCSDGSIPEENCQAPNRCSAVTLTCQPSVPGTDGDSCFTSADCADGFRCDETKCVPQTPDFAPCTAFDECEGTCLIGTDICAPAVSVGGRCTEQVTCLPSEDGDRAICNVPNGIDGRCVLAKSVITTLGTECDPALDACDANRGLSCRFSSSVGKSVCQQRVTHVTGPSFCDPNSEFSQCLPRFGAPMDCLPNFVAPFDGGSDFFRCSARQEQLFVRSICERPGSVCPEGTECMGLPFTSPLTRYCLPLLSEGQFCDDPFEGVCEVPLVCQNGVCINGGENPDEPGTFSGLGGSCVGDLVCASGLLCREEGNELLCLLPVVDVAPMEECFSTPSLDKSCIEGTVCRRDGDGLGVLRCRDPAVVGEYCSTDADCAQGLKCTTENFINVMDTKCYDPKNSLSIGETCGQAGALPCGAADGELLMCLPQVGSSVPKCQKFRGLLSACNPEENIGCFRSSNCESGLCIPK